MLKKGVIQKMARINDVINYQSSYSDSSDVLKNKFGLNKKELLEEKERLLTNYKLADLYITGITGDFDVKHYLSIHKYLFSDIYEFAGEIRSENIQKTLPFCLPNLIYSNLEDTLRRAKRDSARIQNEEELIHFFAYYYSELDIIHPFMEGNGRTEREFFRQYILQINGIIDFGEYEVDYSKIESKDQFIRAVIIADATCDLTELKKYIKNILVNKKVLNK